MRAALSAVAAHSAASLKAIFVVGGGAAGLSAALVLGRARQRTLVIDAGAQSNLAAEGIGGLLGQDGRSPAAVYAAERATARRRRAPGRARGRWFWSGAGRRRWRARAAGRTGDRHGGPVSGAAGHR